MTLHDKEIEVGHWKNGALSPTRVFLTKDVKEAVKELIERTEPKVIVTNGSQFDMGRDRMREKVINDIKEIFGEGLIK